jgi:hypothetical protein
VPLRLLYPNNFDAWILNSKPERMLEGLGACAAYVLATVGFGSWVFTQRDV